MKVFNYAVLTFGYSVRKKNRKILRSGSICSICQLPANIKVSWKICLRKMVE